MKKTIQRNLPITQTYKLVDSFYSSDFGNCCNNCGRPIKQIAVVESKGVRYYIGMDCAETLTGIKEDSFTLEYVHKANFQMAKSARSSLLKLIKKCKTDSHPYQVTTHTDDTDTGFDFMPKSIGKYGRKWKYVSHEIWKKYLHPMIKDLITGPVPAVND